MSEQQTEDLLDELLTTTEPTQMEQEIAAISDTAENTSQRINMLAALVKRTNDPAAIDALIGECFAQGDEPVITVEALLRLAATLANDPMNKVSHADQQRGTSAFLAALAAHEGRSAEEIEREWHEVRRYHEEDAFTLAELGIK
jgi:hypothetical protein